MITRHQVSQMSDEEIANLLNEYWLMISTMLEVAGGRVEIPQEVLALAGDKAISVFENIQSQTLVVKF